MKNFLILLSFILSIDIYSQSVSDDIFSVKAQYLYGNVLKHTKHLENLVKGPANGFEIAAEIPSSLIDKPWPKFYNFPKIGIGASYLSLGNPEMLGYMLSLYPYLNFKVADFNSIQLNVKAGVGLVYNNKTFHNSFVTDETGRIILDLSNAAIGSHINLGMNLGANLEMKLGKGFLLSGELSFLNVTNGSIVQPNSGLNIINTNIGVVYRPNKMFVNDNFFCCVKNLPKKYSVDIIVSGGVKQLYFRDNITYPISSLVVGVYRQMNNILRLGIAYDYFYDASYSAVNASPIQEKNVSHFGRTYLVNDEFRNRFRAGFSIQPEFVFDRLSIGFDLGIYVFNPIKNLEPYRGGGNLDKPLIYAYNIDQEDGWLYNRIVLKYQISNHYFLNFGLKSHLNRAEFIEWGIGYRL